MNTKYRVTQKDENRELKRLIVLKYKMWFAYWWMVSLHLIVWW